MSSGFLTRPSHASSKWRMQTALASRSSRRARNAASLQTAARSAPVNGRFLKNEETHSKVVLARGVCALEEKMGDFGVVHRTQSVALPRSRYQHRLQGASFLCNGQGSPTQVRKTEESEKERQMSQSLCGICLPRHLQAEKTQKPSVLLCRSPSGIRFQPFCRCDPDEREPHQARRCDSLQRRREFLQQEQEMTTTISLRRQRRPFR